MDPTLICSPAGGWGAIHSLDRRAVAMAPITKSRFVVFLSNISHCPRNVDKLQ